MSEIRIPDDLKAAYDVFIYPETQQVCIPVARGYLVTLIERIATLEHELSQARASIASYDAGKEDVTHWAPLLSAPARADEASK